MAKGITLSEIAARIGKHLARFEADKVINAPIPVYRTTRYYKAMAWAAGSRVGVRYVSYQLETFLKKPDALAYLAWLDAGHAATTTRQKFSPKEANDA